MLSVQHFYITTTIIIKTFTKLWKFLFSQCNHVTSYSLVDIWIFKFEFHYPCDTLKLQTQQTFSVWKTSWRSLQDMSWRRLQHVFSVTILRLPRILEDVLQRRFEDGLKMSWRPLARRHEDILEDENLSRWRRLEERLEDMSWRHVLKTSWRFYGDKQNTYWGYLYTYLGITNLDCI